MQRRAEVHRFAHSAPAGAELARIAAALAEGALVAIPTETVYGIAARADLSDAVRKLAHLKGRDAARPLTWHVAGPESLERLPRVSPMARRLIERYWPGPLTLVLPGVARGVEAAAVDGWTGVRCPAHDVCRALLERLPFAVVASSANLHGQRPLVSADAVLEAFGDLLAHIVDGGAPRLGEASVVLKLGPGSFEVLREGILDEGALRASAGLRIGFVCTGNTCRSPMAEGIARALLSKALQVPVEGLARFGFELRSMGVYAMSGGSASQHAIAVLHDQGIDISDHVSRAALPDEIAHLDRVYALTRAHLEALRLLLPPGKVRHCALLDPQGDDIADPVGGPKSEYERAAAQIHAALEARLGEWV